jgi:secreted trypsin-like serine protease
MRLKILMILLGLTFTLNPSTPAQAVYGGTQADGSPLVLTLLTNKNARTSFCSMALITQRIVATAAHCVIADQGVAPNLRWNISDMYVSQPGADVTKDDVETVISNTLQPHEISFDVKTEFIELIEQVDISLWFDEWNFLKSI